MFRLAILISIIRFGTFLTQIIDNKLLSIGTFNWWIRLSTFKFEFYFEKIIYAFGKLNIVKGPPKCSKKSLPIALFTL